MIIEHGQEYLVLRKFNDCGASLEKDEIITIEEARLDSQVYVTVGESFKSWVISGQSIRNNCSVILPKIRKPIPEKIEKKVEITRYTNETFKKILRDLK